MLHAGLRHAAVPLVPGRLLARVRRREPSVYAVVAFGDTTERHERELVKARAERDALTGVLNRATFEDGCTRASSSGPKSTTGTRSSWPTSTASRRRTTATATAGDRGVRDRESVAGVVSAVRDDDLVGRVARRVHGVPAGHLVAPHGGGRRATHVRGGARGRRGLDDDHGPVSISLGIALYPQDGVTYEALYRKADKARTAPSARAAAPRVLPRRAGGVLAPGATPARLPHAALLDGVEHPWRSNTPTLR